MATALINQRERKDISDAEDAFHDPAMKIVGGVFVALGLVILILTGVLIWGVQYRTPGWNAHSYPPPIAHRW